MMENNVHKCYINSKAHHNAARKFNVGGLLTCPGGPGGTLVLDCFITVCKVFTENL